MTFRKFLLLFAFLFPAAFALAQENVPEGKKATVITSDKLRVDTEKKRGIFTGNVTVTDPKFTLKANEMEIFFSKKENGKIEQVVAVGKVELIQLDSGGGIAGGTARGEQAVYVLEKGEIVLTGNPSITQKDNLLSGKVIRFFRNQNKMIVEGGTKLRIFDDEKSPKSETKGTLPQP